MTKLLQLKSSRPNSGSNPSFPKTLAAARALRSAAKSEWSCQWALGDALVEECGAPGENGVNTGGYERLNAAAEALQQQGHAWSFDTLRDFRHVAALFKPGERSPALSWSAHLAAGDPETFQAVIQAAKAADDNVTVNYVRKFKARKKAEQKERERAANGRRVGPEHVIVLAESSKLAAAAQGLGHHFGIALEPHYAGLGTDQINKSIDEVVAVISVWTKDLNRLRDLLNFGSRRKAAE